MARRHRWNRLFFARRPFFFFQFPGSNLLIQGRGLSFWFNPNGVTIPDPFTYWPPGSSICIASIVSSQSWWPPLVSLYVRHEAGAGSTPCFRIQSSFVRCCSLWGSSWTSSSRIEPAFSMSPWRR